MYINRKDIEAFIASGRVTAALDLLENAITAAPHLGNFTSELECLRREYGIMSDYALRGFPDPGRPEAFASLVEGIRRLSDLMERQIKTADSPTLYFNTLRYELTEPKGDPALLLDEYRRINRKLSLASLSENPGEASREFSRKAENIERHFFNRLWTLAPVTAETDAVLRDMIADRSLPRHFKLLAISAVSLGLMELFDERRLLFLMDTYAEAEDDETAIRALSGLLIGLWLFRSRPMSRKLKVRMDSLVELPSWTSDVKNINLQFMRSRDTERITRKFTDEVIPEMMKLRPEIEKLGRMKIDPESIEENPEWAEMLEKSGVADRLKELQEIQEDGGDVMMATFSRLKTFPFFNDISNWFLPFHNGHSLLTDGADSDLAALCDIITGVPMFCDNDKYSVVLSLSSLPASQKTMMMSQLRMQRDQMEQMRFAEARPRHRDEIASSYVRDLYRFFKLFRRKGEFTDPFSSGLNLPALPLLAETFDDAETLGLIGEFYFKRKYYRDAFETFERLSFKMPPAAELFQKMGYCLQSVGDIEGAVRYYEQSELLNSESRWTIRRLASCCRTLGRWEEALGYYRRLADSKPDDVSTALNIGLSLVKLRRYDEALQYLFKAEFLGNSSEKAIRAIEWCTLLGADYTRCAKYTDILLSSSPTANDLLNAGHLAILTGRPADAADYWARSLAARDFDAQSLISEIESDRATIGGYSEIDPVLVGMVADNAVSRARTIGNQL